MEANYPYTIKNQRGASKKPLVANQTSSPPTPFKNDSNLFCFIIVISTGWSQGSEVTWVRWSWLTYKEQSSIRVLSHLWLTGSRRWFLRKPPDTDRKIRKLSLKKHGRKSTKTTKSVPRKIKYVLFVWGRRRSGGDPGDGWKVELCFRNETNIIDYRCYWWESPCTLVVHCPSIS